METKFKSQVCTSRSQSERLLALGLKKETADCCYWQETEPMYGEAAGVWHLEILDSHDNQEHFEYLDKYFGVCLADDEEHYFIPAWSLHRLLSLLPQSVKIGKNYYDLAIIQNEFVRLIDDIGDIYIYFDRDGIYESLLLCIEWLIKEGYFNKEYLV